MLLKRENLAMHDERSKQLGKLSEAVQDVRLSVQGLNSRAWSGERVMEESDITLMTSRIQNLSLAARNFKKENAVLRSLDYEMRTTRRETIPTAHEKTFRWIFTRQSTNQKLVGFMEWLDHGDSPFWLTGRPGSGKSTLMRFISGHSNTLRALERVAAPRKAFIVEHYFWSAGTVIQRSQEGLYRSILLQILSRVPEMVHLLPGVEEKSPEELERGRWNLDRLHAALNALATNDKISTIFGVFIDGIDEYDGDHADICQALLRLSKSRMIKLCISSRPWNVFQDHFGTDKTAMLAVHDLTLKDIQAYITAPLKEHYRWKALTARSHEAEVLFTEVSEKAHGVFLWVFLVTKLLREGMTNDDSIADLRRRLEMFPSDLEPFFKHILDSVEPFYHDKMAGMLAMALAATRPLKAELYAFGENEFDDAEYAIKQPVKVADFNEKEARIQTFTRSLNGRCKGLLEIGPDEVVNFLHRTMRDFLRTKQMDGFLRSKNQTRLEPHTSIFKAYLSFMKQTKFYDRVERGGDGILLGSFSAELEYAFCHVADADTQSDQIVCLIDEMESATIAIFAAGQAWIKPGSEPLTPRRLFRESVLLHGPIHYLSRKLASLPKYFIDFDDPPLVVILLSIAGNLVSASRSAMVKMLLESGADPNEVFFDKDLEGVTTPWQRYVSRVIECRDRSAFIWDIIEVLLSFSAAPNVMTEATYDMKLGHKSVPIQAWLNIFFSAFRFNSSENRLSSVYLRVLTCTLGKDIDISSMTLPTFHLKGSALPTITPWERLKYLIRKGDKYTELQVQALAELAQVSGPDLLPWDDLMPVIREKYSDMGIQIIEEALARRDSVKRSSGQPESGKRIRSREEPDTETRKAKRSKEEWKLLCPSGSISNHLIMNTIDAITSLRLVVAVLCLSVSPSCSSFFCPFLF